MNKTKILFICSHNKDRSKTAEDMYYSDPRYEVKSAGVDTDAVNPVTHGLVSWADVIVVMDAIENRHEFKLHQKFPFLKPMGKKIINFDISGDYTRGDPRLVSLIKSKMDQNFPS